MRSTSIIALTALVGISMVSAASPHGKFDRRSHKALIAERQAKEAAAVNQVSDVTKRASKKYKKRGGKVCRVKDAASASTLASASSTASSTASSSASVAINTPTVAAAILQPATTASASSASSSSSSQAWGDWQQSSSSSAWTSETWPTTTSTSSTHAPAATNAPPANSGLLYASGPCGDSSSSADHPNGALWWLNCGLSDSGGWNPPSVKASDLIAITNPADHPEVFGSCTQYANIFADAAAANNMPTALLMSIGMQESGCNRDATGARGEQGIMQVAGNACDPGDCKEPWYNIHKGAEILVSKMGGDPNGNIISALGQYNGWMPGMHAGAGAVYGPEGQKVSYLDDMLNKWLQGKSSY